MSASLVVAVGCLAAVGTYLATSRILSRIVLGFALLGHAAVLALVASGGPRGEAPLADRVDGETSSNPLPQALSLTAIVISFGLTLFLLALARRQRELSGDDLVEDDLEDRRIASTRAEPELLVEPDDTANGTVNDTANGTANDIANDDTGDAPDALAGEGAR